MLAEQGIRRKIDMKETILTIDGSLGEGGGQVLRASLSLSMALGIPFRMVNIRAKRKVGGLKRQHLTCVQAAKELCGAKVEGAEMHSTEILFVPGPVKAGERSFSIGTGGSVTLVFQALLPALLFGSEPSRITVTGGTHVPYSPPFEFMRDTLFPWIERLGPRLRAEMESVGYMDVGGGKVTVTVEPSGKAGTFECGEKGTFLKATTVIYGHNLPDGVLERETEALLAHGNELGLTRENIEWRDKADRNCPPVGSGNMVLINVRHGDSMTVIGECGWRGRSAETVSKQACKRALEFLHSAAPVEVHLADQLLVPIALAGGGSLTIQRLCSHAETCLKVIEAFTGMKADIGKSEGKGVRISLGAAEVKA